jgi:hypothetical protein
MAAPSMTFNTAGNADASASLAASANRTFNLDLSTKFEGQLTVKAVFGTVAATSGIRIEVFKGYGSTPTYTTLNPNISLVIPSVGSTTSYSPAIHIPTGKWQVKLTNLDGTNAVTCEATTDTVDSI